MEPNLFNDRRRLTGIEFVYWHLPVTLIRYRLTFTFVIMVTSIRSVQIINNRILFSGLVESTGVRLAVAKVTRPGRRPGSMLTVKILALNFGVAMLINDMLSLMNLEELSTYPIFLDSSTSILSEWKQKAHQGLL